MRVVLRVAILVSSTLAACQLISGLEPFELAPPRDASPEGEVDAGVDAGTDAVVEAAPEATVDAAPDAGGAVIRYDFDEATGVVVRDKVGTLDLTLIDPGGTAAWVDGGLFVPLGSYLQSASATDAVTKCNAADAFTAIVWIRPTRLDLTGPARVVTMSLGTGSLRDFTIGLESAAAVGRVRALETSGGAVEAGALTQLALTRATDGTARLFIDGAPVSGLVDPMPLGWVPYPLTFANESTLDRDWEGELHRFELYCSALSPPEVQARYAAGP